MSFVWRATQDAPARGTGGEPPARELRRSAGVRRPLIECINAAGTFVAGPGAESAGGSKGGGATPCQPLPGTREAWPQRVGWLLHRKVLRASPADAAEAAGEGFGCDPSR